MNAVWNEVKAWLAAPYTSQMNALQIFLLTGLVIIFVIAWTLILRRLE